MKTFKLLIIGIVLVFANPVHSQVSVSVNIGSPPMWGPVGYTDVQYYYLPDVQAYYDVPSSRFIYYEGGTWVHRTYLPARYRNYDLYGGYKVVMNDYHGNSPYTHFKEHKMKYARGYRGPAQKNIGMRPGRGNSGPNYSREANHGRQIQGPGHGNGNGNSKNNGNGNGNKGGHGKRK